MGKEIDEFLELANKFSEHGYFLYLVGGTVRDFLLGLSLVDMDAVTDATPSEVKSFIPDADFTFSKMGSMRIKSNGVKFDVTTLRKEKAYRDSRHPLNVKFVKHLDVDVVRRDFSINAMYLDKHFKLIDYVNGLDDLNHGLLKMVGNPNKRLKEDPLRIIRAIRFSLMYDLTIDERLAKSMHKNIKLLNLLNIEKIKMDIKKIKNVDEEKKVQLFNEFNIKHYLDMIH